MRRQYLAIIMWICWFSGGSTVSSSDAYIRIIVRRNVFFRLSPHVRRLALQLILLYQSRHYWRYSCVWRVYRLSLLRIDPLQHWMFVFHLIDIWIFGLARSVRVNFFALLWLWACRSIVSVTPLAPRDFTLGHLMLVIENCFFAFDGVALLP